MSDLSQVVQNLINNNKEESERDSNLNSNIAHSRNEMMKSMGQVLNFMDAGFSSLGEDVRESGSGVKESVKDSQGESKEDKNEGRRNLKETIKFLGDKLGNLGKVIGSGFGKAKDSLSEVLGPALTFIKSVVVGGLIFLFFKKLPDILNSPLFGEIINTIKTVVIPALQKLYHNFIVPFAKNIGERLLNLFKDINDETKSVTDVLFENAGILSAAVGLLALKFFGVSGIIKGVGLAVGIIKTALLPLLPAALPFIAVGAAVVGAFALVITAIQNIRDRFTEGQGFLERLKIIAQEIFLSPVRLFQNILGFIAEKLGFENFAETVRGFNPLAFLSNLLDTVSNFFKEKFSLNEKTKEDIAKAGAFVMKIAKAIGNIIMAPFKLLGKIIPDKLKKFFGFGGGDEKNKTDPFAGQGETAGGDTSGASIIEEEERGFFGNLKKSFKMGSENMSKNISFLRGFNPFDLAAKKIREDKKIQKQEIMDATYGSANREEFAKQVAAGVLATQGTLAVDQSKRAKFTSQEVDEFATAGIDVDKINNLALTNELLKARAAGETLNTGNTVSTNVVDNSNNSTTIQEEVILDPKINDYNFMTSAAADF